MHVQVKLGNKTPVTINLLLSILRPDNQFPTTISVRLVIVFRIRGCLDCKWNREFFMPGLPENVSIRDDFTTGNLENQHNVPAKRAGVFT